MKIEIDVSDDKVRNFVGRANIGYWGTAKSWDPDDLRLVIVEDDGGVEVVIDSQRWPAALAKMATEHATLFADVMNNDGDQWTGDVLIQLAAFGEEKYA